MVSAVRIQSVESASDSTCSHSASFFLRFSTRSTASCWKNDSHRSADLAFDDLVALPQLAALLARHGPHLVPLVLDVAQLLGHHGRVGLLAQRLEARDERLLHAGVGPALPARPPPAGPARAGKHLGLHGLEPGDHDACWSWRDGSGPGASSAARASRSARSASRSVSISPCASFSASSHSFCRRGRLSCCWRVRASRTSASRASMRPRRSPGAPPRVRPASRPATSAVHSRRSAFQRVRASGRSVAASTCSAPSRSWVSLAIFSARASGDSSTSASSGSGRRLRLGTAARPRRARTMLRERRPAPSPRQSPRPSRVRSASRARSRR